MEYEIVNLEEKIAVGVSARTSNMDPNVGAVIGGLWETLYQKGVHATIPGKVNEKALGIYTDYTEDKCGYTAIAASEVAEEADVEGCVVCRIPAGKYARFVIHGDMVKAVSAAWQEIWEMNLPRTFQCDFEEYQDDSMENATIHIYVGLL